MAPVGSSLMALGGLAYEFPYSSLRSVTAPEPLTSLNRNLVFARLDPGCPGFFYSFYSALLSI